MPFAGQGAPAFVCNAAGLAERLAVAGAVGKTGPMPMPMPQRTIPPPPRTRTP